MHRKLSPRAEYLAQEKQRVAESASLLDRFQELKTLTVEVVYYDADSFSKRAEMKYSVNLAHAKSVFRFSCPNNECVGGDFDLSAPLANAVHEREETAIGELICQGWHNQSTIGRVPCRNILRYKFSLGY
jgi:hypothetical protein